MHPMQVGTASPRELRRTTIFPLHLTVFDKYVLVLSTLPLSWTLGYMLFWDAEVKSSCPKRVA